MTAQGDPRGRLLAGATHWVLEHGLTALSLRPLAAALGTSDRMLIHHFRSKDELIDAVLARANAELTETASIGAPETVTDLWRQLAGDTTAPYLRLYFEVFGLALQQPERYRPALLAVHGAWQTLLARMLDPADPTGPEAVRRATAAVALIDGLLLDLLVTGERARVEAAAQWSLARLYG